MPRQLIRNATVLPFTHQPSGELDLTVQKADVLVEDDRIMEVAARIEAVADSVNKPLHHCPWATYGEYETERAEMYHHAERLMPAIEATYQKAMAQPLPIERFTRIE
ncbi:hypothetical protein IQ241_16770 [Romeria aff. gracilis LEGE 07310]|uniref:Uncharacterized protein n=1 Tax=Vasconcelosia minhoensis LEGE 07310 TaxID=915328 RepID=A0A8J7AGX3_9CYAN|nr:hypothetical protein [Romeria gracilis]MBE9078926.1 hypothetical protein [Romeria aff. gracilis LEGE 07310]